MGKDLLREQPLTPKDCFKKNIMTIGNKTITYSHIYPTEATKIRLSLKERIRVLFGVPLVLNLNIYLNDNKVVHTTALLSSVTSLNKAKNKE